MHIGSDVTIAEDELVSDPVVAVGGSVTVLGRVNDDVVAVGGGVHLGPKAVVTGDVTSVGGRID
ncbi:MAG TPA: polymer-forming cytoskeletal protein, partial [Chloroflexota bacterium]|nr:polymer-forming cytoskeletal protein [Chloroflexota bacterium]